MKEVYRVIYNQDCTNLFATVKEPLEPRHVDRMVDEVAEGGADVMLINPNAQRVNYPSKAWQTFWDGYAPGRREFFGPVPDKEVADREAWVLQMKRLADQGCDYLARSLARCRQKKIAPGITIRMNDMHDAPTPGTHLFSRFHMEHPELWLNNPSACGWGARGLNYEHEAVRRHYLALIEELARGYDFDVLELDFLRFHCYFPRDQFARHGDIMTGFIRDVRAALAASGRRIALMARVAATPGAAYELGFDVASWAREKLVDGISAGAFLNTQWQVAVDDYRALVGGSVAVYACADYTIDRRPGLPARSLPTEPLFLRGFAAGHLAAGADGVELFNFFCAREEAWESKPKEPSFATLRELQSLDALRARPRSHTVTSGWAVGETDGVLQVPVVMETSKPRQFMMFLAAAPAGSAIEAEVLCEASAVAPADQLWLQMNGLPVGPAVRVQDHGTRPESAPGKADVRFSAVFAVPSGMLRDGRNTLALRNEGSGLTVVSIDVRVGEQVKTLSGHRVSAAAT